MHPLKYLLAGCTLVLLANCTKKQAPGKEQTDTPITPIAVSAAVRESVTGFSFSFFKNLLKEQKINENVFVSPLSLHMAMGMVANGADGETQAEIKKALDAADLSMDALNKTYLDLLEKLPAVDPGTKLGLANSLWYRNSFSVENDFIGTLKNYFKAQVTSLPFNPPDAAIINKWANDHTSGRIPTILQEKEMTQELVLLLMNALYFKGTWRARFDKSRTENKEFIKADGSRIPVQMMQQTDTVRYMAGTAYDVIRKEYGNGQFAMTFILPKENHTLQDYFNGATQNDWDALASGLTTTKVQLEIPKFTLRQEFLLNATLKAMGIKKAFDPGQADFSGISKTKTFVSFVKQNTFCAVDEEGTEAAAVTIVGMEVTSAPIIPKFVCNRPFGIIISETTSNTILFMGRIAAPSVQ